MFSSWTRIILQWMIPLLVFGSVCGAQSPVKSDILTTEERAWLATHPVIYLAPDPAYEPIEFFDEQGVFRGISADYVALLEQRLGLRFQVVNRRKVQADWDAGQVRVDAMPTCVATPEREKTWTFTTPYLKFPTYFITRKSVPESLTEAQFKGLRVAVVAGYGVQEYLATKHPEMILDPVPDTRIGLQKVSFGLVDAFVSDLPVATYWMEREGITNLKTSSEVGYVYQLGFGLPSDRRPLNSIVEKGLAQITTEERAAIYRKWVKINAEPVPANRRVWWALLAGLGVVSVGLLLVFGWNRTLAAQVKERTAALQQELQERKQTEQELRASEERFATIFQASPAPLAIARFADGKVLDVNESWARISGYHRDDLVGRLAPETRLWLSLSRRSEIISTLGQGQNLHNWEVYYQNKAGQERVGNLSIEVLRLNGEWCNLWAMLDLTDRKRAEEALQQSESLFRSLTETTSAWVFIAQGTRLCYFNAAAEAGIGYTRDELTGQEFWGVIHPDDHQLIRERIQRRQQGLPLPLIYEARVLTKMGETRWMQVSTTTIEYNQAAAELSTAFDITDRKYAEQALQQSEEMFRSLTETTSAWVFIEQDNRCTYVNSAAAVGTGYSRAELATMNPWELVHPDEQRRIQSRMQARKQNIPLPPSYETCILTKAGELRWLQITTTPIEYRGAFAVLGTAFDITARKRAEEQLKISEQQLRQLAGYLQTVREDERTAIAREIHDELGQALTAIKMDVVWANHRFPNSDGALQKRLSATIELVNSTINTVRKLATQLRPGILDDLGLIAALEWQAQEFQARTDISCEFDNLANNLELEPARATAVFRICQEALTNVARHAQATKVSISLQQEAANLVLEVIDNGRGVTDNELANPHSLGLLGMRERAFLLGGNFSIKGRPNGGTMVTAQIPLFQSKAKGGAS